MLRLMILATFLTSAALTAAPEKEQEEVKYEEDILIKEPECLQLMTMGGRGISDHSIKFYNSCPKRIWASVCVEERPGKFKLHQSTIPIPRYGYMDVYTYEGTPPLSVHWISGSSRPTHPPGQCGMEEKK